MLLGRTAIFWVALALTAAAQVPSAARQKPSLPAPPPRGQRPLNQAAGQVVSSDGLALPGAEITAGGARVRTDAQGRFRLPVRGFPVHLQVTAEGFAPALVIVRGPRPVRIAVGPAPVAAQVTVAATGRRQAVTAVPVLAATMGARQISTAPEINLDSLLRQFPALATYRRSDSLNAHPTTQGISLLGTGSSGASRALVLRDGIPLNDFYGGWVDWLRVPEESIAQLTVVEGGASPLYGSGALSGVITVTSHQPNHTRASLQTAEGNLGTGLVDSYSSADFGALALGLGQQSLTTAGYIPVPPAEAGAVDTPAGVTANEFAPEIRYIPNPRLLIALRGEYYGEHRNNGTREEQNATGLRQLALHADFAAGGFWQGSLFGQSEDFASSFTSVAANRDSELLVLEQRVPAATNGAALEWSAAQDTPWGPVHAILGASYLRISAVDQEQALRNRKTPDTNHAGRQRLAGAFGEAQWRPAPSLQLTATVRDDHWRNYDAFTQSFNPTAAAPPPPLSAYPERRSSAISPSVGAVWHPRGALSFRASAYQSFRAPTLNELYRPFRVGNIETLANPALTAERYRGYQAGADLRLGRQGLLRATYFDGVVANVITAVPVAQSAQLVTDQRQNLGRLRAHGEELDARIRMGENLWLRAAYTHLQALVQSAPTAALVGRHIAEVPGNNASLRAVTAWRGWHFSAEERFGGAQFEDDLNTVPLPAFWTTGIYASRPLGYRTRWLQSVAPYLAVQNLFNRRYAVTIDPVPNLASPRLWMAGLKFTLGRD